MLCILDSWQKTRKFCNRENQTEGNFNENNRDKQFFLKKKEEKNRKCKPNVLDINCMNTQITCTVYNNEADKHNKNRNKRDTQFQHI